MKRLLLLMLVAVSANAQVYHKDLRVKTLYVEEIRFDSAGEGGHLISGTRPKLTRGLGGVEIYNAGEARYRVDTTVAENTTVLSNRIDSIAQALSGKQAAWTFVRLANDFTTSSGTAVDVTGLAFTPAASQRYEIYGVFLLRTATTTVGPRPGVAWPTGMTDGVVTLRTTSSATAFLTANGNINGAVLTAVGGLPTTTQSYPGYIEGILIAGASPSGTFKIQLASETAGTNVTMKAGSYIKYRTY